MFKKRSNFICIKKKNDTIFLKISIPSNLLSLIMEIAINKKSEQIFSFSNFSVMLDYSITACVCIGSIVNKLSNGRHLKFFNILLFKRH